MPELPDVLTYVHCLRPRVVGRRLVELHIRSPFILRTAEPTPESLRGRRVLAVQRLGKRIVLQLEADCFVVVHLMIAGRLQWIEQAPPRSPRTAQAAFEFEDATLLLVEAAKQKRASIHLTDGAAALAAHERGGLDVLNSTADEFAAVLRAANHTLKRALTDPRTFDGIGNAYSDEILFAAGLSPLQLTSRLSNEQAHRLYGAARAVLSHWIDLLRERFAGRFPTPAEITAFRPEFAVHGRFGQPCRTCGAPVQRIRYAANETNYCARCQNEGRVLADRSLSRLLRDDWPRSIDDWF